MKFFNDMEMKKIHSLLQNQPTPNSLPLMDFQNALKEFLLKISEKTNISSKFSEEFWISVGKKVESE